MSVNQTLSPATQVLVQWAHEWSGQSSTEGAMQGLNANAAAGYLTAETNAESLIWHHSLHNQELLCIVFVKTVNNVLFY